MLAAEGDRLNPDLIDTATRDSIDVQSKYNEERDKRLKSQGYRQYIDLHQTDQHQKLIEDPWIPSGTAINTPVSDGGHTRFLVVGAGWTGILAAVKLIQAGFGAEDLLLVDPAGGFGGTWWWNRYPGLACDVESYIYLPLLEEMDYMPTRRYASGHEIRKYAEMVCSKYGLYPRAMFQSSVTHCAWDDNEKEWTVKIARRPKGGTGTEQTLRADYVVFASGVLNNPKLADLSGIGDFQGHMFHTSRWDYDYTGGTEETPELLGLQGKKVAIIGTGATAVQAVPHLAKYAKELLVFQRTPSGVDVRDNHDTNPATFKEQVATGKGWWHDRNANFTGFLQNFSPPPSKNLVNDAWTAIPSYAGLLGGPREVTMENMADYVKDLYALDHPRQEAVRNRVDEIVQDKNTAASLKAWYPTWCKRPCFNDDYLAEFNAPHVTLVDTDGKGVDNISKEGVVANGQEYKVDVIIWSTGYRSPLVGSPAGKADVQVNGREGVEMNEMGQFRTVHGVCSKDFPNMLYLQPLQVCPSANYNYIMDIMSTHMAYIMSAAFAKVAAESTKPSAANGSHSTTRNRPLIEPTAEGQAAWEKEILLTAPAFLGLDGCTPGYLNLEGDADKVPEEWAPYYASGGRFGRGMPAFLEKLESWRQEGSMKGLSVESIA